MIRSRRQLRSAMMIVFVFAYALVAASPARAQAPRPTPDKNLIGYGFDGGVMFPDAAFESTLTLDGFGEYYLTPRISVRAMLVWASPGIDTRPGDHFKQFKLLFGGNYNWIYKSLRPFAGGGAGAHFLSLKLDDGLPDPEGETRGGIYFGGGSDFILNDESAIKAEFRWDMVSDPPGLPDASGMTITVGYKRFF